MKREDVEGHFTRNLFSLQMQIQTLLDGAGGGGAAEFLDCLSELSESERKVVLKVFQKALSKLKDSGLRLKTVQDQQLDSFEEVLYEELVDGMTVFKEDGAERYASKQNEALKRKNAADRLSVVDGGKLPTRKKETTEPICLREARRRRQENLRTLQ
ncbi:MAG: hypothetical protein KDD70_04675 [Bdellovibrionales bacterium]|nr:hypothetical protein [Bdellovibrionales bacterium]